MMKAIKWNISKNLALLMCDYQLRSFIDSTAEFQFHEHSEHIANLKFQTSTLLQAEKTHSSS